MVFAGHADRRSPGLTDNWWPDCNRDMRIGSIDSVGFRCCCNHHMLHHPHHAPAADAVDAVDAVDVADAVDAVDHNPVVPAVNCCLNSAVAFECWLYNCSYCSDFDRVPDNKTVPGGCRHHSDPAVSTDIALTTANFPMAANSHAWNYCMGSPLMHQDDWTGAAVCTR